MAAFCTPAEMAAPAPPGGGQVSLFPMGRLRWIWDGKLKAALAEQIQAADVVHIHGLWQEHCTAGGSLCRRLRKPYVVSAHGMLDPWSLNHKRLKKMLYLRFGHRAYMARASCLRALTASEIEDYRSVGLRNRAVLIPNGIEEPPGADPREFLEKYPHLRNRKLLLFLGRLHHKKGADILLEVWSRLRRQYEEWHLVLAGPDEDGAAAALAAMIARTGISGSVTLTGMLSGSLKWAALRAASLFVLPSHSEGFSVAVLEALACGIPVVITRQCHFPEVVPAGCGWECDVNAADISAALSQALGGSAEDLAGMGKRGRELAAGRYSWASVGRATADMLDSVLGEARHAAS